MALKKIQYDVQLLSTETVLQANMPAVYTNDLNSAEFVFNILDMTAEQLAGATATTLLYMRDGSFFQNSDVNLDGTTFTYLLKENEGNHAGLAQIQLVVKIGTIEYATQLFNFQVAGGLETKVAKSAVEVMIQDWTTLTREAQAYIAQFLLDEATRQQQFDDAQTERTNIFTQSETERATAFEESEELRQQKETERQEAESGRIEDEALRQAGYDADHGRATSDHIVAETDHATAVADHTMVQGYNTRLTAEETATADNKISAVKGKTFADVDARFEDVEFDTTLMGKNLVTNGDASNGSTGWWYVDGVSSGRLYKTAITQYGSITQKLSTVIRNKHYVSIEIEGTTDNYIKFGAGTDTFVKDTTKQRVSLIATPTSNITTLEVGDKKTAGWLKFYIDNAVCIDLTTTFGAGNEPTVEQMDAIMAKFPNSWFDGTKNLFRASETLKKQIAIDARTEFDAKNLVVNGDFSNGTTGWNGNSSTISVQNNTLTSTSNGQSVNPNVATATGNKIIPQANEVYYIKSKVRATSASCTKLDFYLFGNGVSKKVMDMPYPVENTWYTLRGVIKIDPIHSGIELTLYNAHAYSDATTGNGKAIEVQYVSIINLTATFGAGKEPTLAEMDRLMARFPNSWFDGTKPIQTIETLYQEKANKVQEAWITPTLINGWVNFDSAAYPSCAYMKDEMGFVHLKGMVKGGTIGSNLFVLPPGYRPLKITYFTVDSSNAWGQCIVSANGLVSAHMGGATWFGLDNITFRAEA